MIVDAHWSSWTTTEVWSAYMMAISVEDGFVYECFAQKYSVEPKSLSAKIMALSPAEAVALMDGVDVCKTLAEEAQDMTALVDKVFS